MSRHRIEIEFDADADQAQQLAEALDWETFCQTSEFGIEDYEISMTPVVNR